MHAQTSLYKPILTNRANQNPEILLDSVEGTDPRRCSEDHVVVRPKNFTVFAFQNDVAPNVPNMSSIPRTIVYFSIVRQ